MIKLKTLKDLVFKKPLDDDYLVGYERCKEDLKQEAIKRYKSILKEREINGDVGTGYWYIMEGKLQEIEEFYNLTSEDELNV